MLPRCYWNVAGSRWELTALTGLRMGELRNHSASTNANKLTFHPGCLAFPIDVNTRAVWEVLSHFEYLETGRVALLQLGSQLEETLLRIRE